MTNTELSDAVREALDTVPAEVSHHGTHPPDPKDVYVVPGHEKALNPDTLIIVGDRGTGKSFWSAALHSETTRILINQQLRRLNLRSTNVSWGFASEVGSQDYPSHRTLSDLVQKKKLLPDDIWRTVFLHQLLGRTSWGDGIENWEQRVQWVAENSEKAEARISEINANLRSEGRRHLIIFDALDRLGPDWFSIRQILVGLLRVCLFGRSCSCAQICLKIEGFGHFLTLQNCITVVLIWLGDVKTYTGFFGIFWRTIFTRDRNFDNIAKKNLI